jgi:hypothetical protein
MAEQVVLPVSTGRAMGLNQVEVALLGGGPTIAQEQEMVEGADGPLWIPGVANISQGRVDDLVGASNEAQVKRQKAWDYEDYKDVTPAGPSEIQDWIDNDIKPRLERRNKIDAGITTISSTTGTKYHQVGK